VQQQVPYIPMEMNSPQPHQSSPLRLSAVSQTSQSIQHQTPVYEDVLDFSIEIQPPQIVSAIQSTSSSIAAMHVDSNPKVRLLHYILLVEITYVRRCIITLHNYIITMPIHQVYLHYIIP
jgi:hypothetical protein